MSDPVVPDPMGDEQMIEMSPDLPVDPEPRLVCLKCRRAVYALNYGPVIGWGFCDDCWPTCSSNVPDHAPDFRIDSRG